MLGARGSQVVAKNSKNPYSVKVGQVWRDNDPRSKGREVEVLEIDGDHIPFGRAKCRNLNPPKRGRAVVWIRLDRFNSSQRGYTLAKEKGKKSG